MSDAPSTPPEWLPEPIDVNGVPSEVFALLYLQFRLDFLDSSCYLRDAPVHCSRFKKEGEEYEEAFWHLVTREEHSTGARLLDTRRAQKLAWCAAVIANCDDTRVTAWNYLEGTGKKRIYLWLRDWDYVVILEERKGVFWLITAFDVDARKRYDFEGRYNRRER